MSNSDLDKETTIDQSAGMILRQRRPYEPSPMSWILSDHSREFDTSILEIIDSPPTPYDNVSDAVKSVIAQNYHASRALLTQKNHESLELALLNDNSSHPEIPQLVNYAKLGLIYPIEVIRLLDLLDPLESAEITKVTHPYGVRADLLVSMMRDVAEALDAIGADMKSFDVGTSRIRFFDDSRRLTQGIFTIKNIIATAGDIAITERRSFAFQSNMSGFPADIKQGMHEASQVVHKITNEQNYMEWYNMAFIKSGFDRHIRNTVDSGNVPPYLIPVSTVIYGHKSARDVRLDSSK